MGPPSQHLGQRVARAFTSKLCGLCPGFANDPAAGSPTTTLLRLLLPLKAEHCPISAGQALAS